MTKAAQKLLEQHFDIAFAAPDGIARLRELILTLAMQGQLVEQDPNDPPASELLKEIKAEKQRLLKAGEIKKSKALPPIKPEEVPYELPKGWEWVRLGEIGIINPRNDADDSAKAGFVPMPMIPTGYSETHQFEERPWSDIKKGYTHFANGDVGMAKITPCFENAKSCVFSDLPNGIGAGTTELHIFRNLFNSVVPRFLLYYLKNPRYISNSVSSMTGSAGQKRVPTPYFTEQQFPLPPLSEQHRIVARIDQLMARCDALETLRKQQEEKRLAVHAAAIRQLLDTPDGSAWDFIGQHFGELYTVKENVAELRKAILQLAVMGCLVPQNPNDPPASELLKEIKTEKQRLLKAGKIKKPKALPLIMPEEVPYELPEGWEWMRLGELGITQTGTTPPSKDLENYGDDIPFVGPGDIKNGCIDYSGKGLSKQGLLKGRLIDANSILMVCIGGSIGKHAVNEKDITCNQQINTLTPYSQIPVKYIYDVMAAGYFQDAVISQAGGSATPIINKQKWSGIPIPLPPLPEQHRIVVRLDQLMALCDTLEQQIDAATGKQTELLSAVMAQV
nr:restriction endonuclease subunit S [uncultured Desulfobacter sp.]